MSITLYERVDIEKLMEVLNCDNIPFNPLTDESEWFEQMKKQLIRYSQQKRTNNGIKVTYKQKNKHGRFCTPFGQQTIQRDIRKYIGSYRDYDFSNCHPIILDILFKNNGIFDPFLAEYNANREETIKKYNLRDKQVVISVINNETPSQNPVLNGLSSNVSKLIDILLKEPANKNLLKRVTLQRKKDKKPYNFRGSFMAHYLQNIENDCLMVFYDWCNRMSIPVTILMFDGLGIDKSFAISNEQLLQIEDEIK